MSPDKLSTSENVPVLGMAGKPESLNPLHTSSAYSATIMNAIYTHGTALHPDQDEVVPWGFRDWELYPENAGTSDPTVVVELRDDLTWSDGRPVTAEDVQFTVEYTKEQQASGILADSDFGSVEDVTVDSDSGTTVSYFFERKDCAWATRTLGAEILPKHKWRNVSDYRSHRPLEYGGPVGSGPFVVEEYGDDEFLLRRRDEEFIPWNRLDYTEWLDEDGPFIDGLRIRIFETNDEREEALLNGDIDQPFGPIEIDIAANSRDIGHLELMTIDDDGWGHISFNNRRTPLDDCVFRQFLVMLMDHTAIVEDYYQEFGARKGTYVTPAAYEDWRPPEPTEIDEYEGIPIPSLEFPGNRGEFTLDDDHVERAWEFLLDHEDAKHDYSLGEAVTDLTGAPGGKEIYVNGRPLTEAHTDNEGNDGHGPFDMSRNPPDDEPTPRVNAVSGWIDALQRVGIPIEPNYQTWAEQSRQVYITQEFDMYERGWDGITANNDHYTTLFSSAGANFGENEEERRYRNTMGYMGADELIQEQRRMMNPERRKPVVKRVLAQIWYDAPTLVQEYIKNLQPVTTRFTGRVQTVGGVNNKQSWLNMRLHESDEK